MHVADLVDLEWLLGQRARDRANDREPRPLRPSARDAARSAAAGVRADRRAAAALAGWLEVERLRRDRLPGAGVAAALGTLRLVLVVVGLLVGMAVAAGLLAYDGSTPVNLLWFLGVFVGVQALVLIGSLLLMMVTRRPPVVPGLRRLVSWLRRDGREIWPVGATRHGDWAGTERWLLFAAAQRFGVAFNLGALFAVLGLVAASDLTFCWATTLRVDAGDVHRLVNGLATPWSWLSADLVPDADVVAQSRWSRMQGAFVVVGIDQTRAEELAGAWWPFLLSSVVCYGLLPRLLAWVAAAGLLRRALLSARFDGAEARAVVDELLADRAGWDAPDPGAVRGPAPTGDGTAADPAAGRLDGRTLLVLWGALGADRELPARLGARFPLQVIAEVAAGGMDLDADDRALAALAAPEMDRVVLVCDAGQQPTKDLLGFLRRSFEAAPQPGPWFTVLLIERRDDGSLVGADADERGAWARSLAALGNRRAAVAEVE